MPGIETTSPGSIGSLTVPNPKYTVPAFSVLAALCPTTNKMSALTDDAASAELPLAPALVV